MCDSNVVLIAKPTQFSLSWLAFWVSDAEELVAGPYLLQLTFSSYSRFLESCNGSSSIIL